GTPRHIGSRADAVGEGGGGGFIDNTNDIQAGDAAGVAGGLALGIVEIGGHGDYGLAQWTTEMLLRASPKFAQDHGGDFLRRKVFAVDLNFHGVASAANDAIGQEGQFFLNVINAQAHETLDGVDGVLR